MSFQQQPPGGQQSPYGSHGPLPPTSSSSAGLQPKKRGISPGVWIGIGAALLAAILLTVFGLNMAKRGGGDGGTPAGGAATASPTAEQGAPTEAASPSGESSASDQATEQASEQASSSAEEGEPAAGNPTEATKSYFAALKDGKAQQAIKLLNTEYVSNFDPKAVQFKDEVYAKAKNRPESFSVTDVEEIGETMAKVTGTVKQKERELPVTLSLNKVGGVWKISPTYRSLSVPTVKGGLDTFGLSVNGAELASGVYTLSGALPGDYDFSGPKTDYFTSTDVTKTVWADGSAEAAGTASSIAVTPTAKATATAEKAVQDALVTCAKKQDVKTCGSKFKVKGLDFTLTDLTVAVREKPVLSVEPSTFKATRFEVKTTTPGVIGYDYKADGIPESQDKDLSVSGSVELGADGKVTKIQLY